MPNYTDFLDLYLPSLPDEFQVTFVPGLEANFQKLNDYLKNLTVDFTKAVGDGTTDDSAQLQKEIDESGILKLESGKTYKITVPLTGRKVKIFGNGAKILYQGNTAALDFRGILKGNKAVTADYKEGSMIITLADVTNINVGDIIHVQSIESYNSERSYYYRGGNAIVTGISGNDVTLSHAFPADMSAANITTCEIYNPGNVYIEELEVQAANDLTTVDRSADVIHIAFAAKPVLKDVSADNGVNCIHMERCVNGRLIGCHTYRSYYVDTGTSYGILNNSCSGLILIACTTNSGRHGYTSGGQEPVIGTQCYGCNFKSEDAANFSFDTHGNCYSTALYNCTLDSFQVNGNIRMEACTITNGAKDDNYVYPAEAYYRASFVFENCRFLGTVNNIKVVGYYQVMTSTRKYIDKIVIRDCIVTTDLWLSMQLEDTVTGVKAEISSAILENTRNCRTLFKDNLGYLLYKNCSYVNDAVQVYQSSGTCDEFHIEDCLISNRYNVIYFTNFRYGELKNPLLTNVGSTTGSMRFASATAYLKFDSCDLTGLPGGVSIGTVAKGIFIGSKIKWKETNFYTFFTTASGDFVKGADGLLYTLGIDSGGAIIKTAVPQAG